MKHLILSIFTILTLLSCSGDDDNQINVDEQNFLIFGHFYVQCEGEHCVETFKLTDKFLFEDTVGNYNGEDFEFIQLENDKFELVENLNDFFPNELLNQNETVFGCPDCADAGGLLIQYSKDGNVKSWKIDQVKENVPEYLHNFIDKVNEKIELINR